MDGSEIGIAVHSNAVAASRLLKPTIPLVGEYGIPIRDEIELEYWLGAARNIAVIPVVGVR